MRRLRGWDRSLLAGAARRMFATRTATPLPPAACQSILLVRVDERLGNLICLQQLIDALRAARPRAELALLAAWKMRRVARCLQGLDRLHLIDKRWPLTHPVRWWRAIEEIRHQGYQLTVDASAWHEFSFTHAALAWWSGAPHRIGYRRPNSLSGFHDILVDPGPETEYEGRQRQRLLDPLGIFTEPPPPRTALGLEQKEYQTRWLERHLPHHPWVGIWPGGRKRERRNPPELFARLAGELSVSHDASFLVLWGRGERPLAEKLAQYIGPSACPAPPTDLEQLAGLLRSLELFITNDTGPMHLAVAVGTPTLTLFASGEPSRWGHPGNKVRNLYYNGPQSLPLALQAARELLG